MRIHGHVGLVPLFSNSKQSVSGQDDLRNTSSVPRRRCLRWHLSEYLCHTKVNKKKKKD
jgi:hypothetical protein